MLHTNFVGRRTNAPAVVGPLAPPSGDIGENDKDKTNKKKNNMLNLNHTHESTNWVNACANKNATNNDSIDNIGEVYK